jgi:DNA-binding NarL/FixJ family response regulator
MHASDRNETSVLLVEENDLIRESLRNWITMRFPDVRLIETTDHTAGIHLSRSQSPDVVLMDIAGLGRGGIRTVQGMKTAHPAAVILALVALEHESHYQAVLEAGADGCACVWRIGRELLPQLEESLGPDWASGDR